ncbi:MFS transporter [Pseudomonas putida]
MTLPLLLLLATAHVFNDLFQAVLPSLYPRLKSDFALSYSQIGLITLAFHATGCLCQPLVGALADRFALRWLLPLSMLCMALGMGVLGLAQGFAGLAGAAALVGLGSSLFHPQGSRLARQLSNGRPGLAQSVFQLGGNVGSALGPLLLAALLVVSLPVGAAWLVALALLGGGLLVVLVVAVPQAPSVADVVAATAQVPRALLLLAVLVMSKYVYLAAIANFYTFFLMDRFGLSTAQAQVQLFIFLAAIAAGSLIGGPLGDRIGRKPVIVLSILGVCPFTLWLPYASLPVTTLLSVVIGVTLASAFAAILVMAQELLPGRTGLVAGLFFGLTFGISGMAAAGLGMLADQVGVAMLFRLCAVLPLLGGLGLALPGRRQPAG